MINSDALRLKNLWSVLDGVFTEAETAQTVVDSYQDRVYYSSLFLDPVIPKKAAILDSVLFKDGSLLVKTEREELLPLNSQPEVEEFVSDTYEKNSSAAKKFAKRFDEMTTELFGLEHLDENDEYEPYELSQEESVSVLRAFCAKRKNLY